MEEEEQGGGNFPRELCCGGVQTRAVREHIWKCRLRCAGHERTCAACVRPRHWVSRVTNRAGGAVTRAKKVWKFPQAQRGMGEGTHQYWTSSG